MFAKMHSDTMLKLKKWGYLAFWAAVLPLLPLSAFIGRESGTQDYWAWFLYFVVFGAAIGSRITEVEGVSYGAFIVPGLIMLTVITQSIATASIGIYFPKFIGTFFELLAAEFNVFRDIAAHMHHWSLISDDFRHHAIYEVRVGSELLILGRVFVEKKHTAGNRIPSSVVAADDQ